MKKIEIKNRFTGVGEVFKILADLGWDEYLKKWQSVCEEE